MPTNLQSLATGPAASTGPPLVSRYAPRAMVSSVDNLATEAGVQMLRRGGSAVDAAVAANAVLTVVLPNQCGLGGDLFALVHRDRGIPTVLNASGHAGSGADPAALRAEGFTRMPARDHVASVPVPGCVDGWVELSQRYGRLGLEEVLEPARRYADEGFAAPPYLAEAVPAVATSSAGPELAPRGSLMPGEVIRRPGIGRLLAGIAADGRRDFYEGEFGESLVALGAGQYTEDDLRRPHTEWVDPLSVRLWGRDVWTAPPSSQGYLALSSGWITERLDPPGDPADPMWAHLLVEAARQAAFDRPEVLHEGADGRALISAERLEPRLTAISRTAVSDVADPRAPGGTTYLCAVDDEGMSVSLIQSNGMSFGSHLVVGDTGVFLHNRGIGFCLEEGHPAEYGPGRRPPHTLAPILVTNPDGPLHALLGTRGGDSQPQVLLQLLTRLLLHEQEPATAAAAGRWVLRGAEDDTSFNTWGYHGSVRVALEGQVPGTWATALEDLGHRVEREAPYGHPFGHAQVIVHERGRFAGAADPRALSGAVGGF